MVCGEVQESAVGVFFFSPDMKNVLLSKYEDKWAWPRAVVLYTTCSDSYLSCWPAGLDRLQCMVHTRGWREKEERCSPLPS